MLYRYTFQFVEGAVKLLAICSWPTLRFPAKLLRSLSNRWAFFLRCLFCSRLASCSFTSFFHCIGGKVRQAPPTWKISSNDVWRMGEGTWKGFILNQWPLNNNLGSVGLLVRSKCYLIWKSKSVLFWFFWMCKRELKSVSYVCVGVFFFFLLSYRDFKSQALIILINNMYHIYSCLKSIYLVC